MFLLVEMFKTEMICFEKLGFFLFLGQMLLRYPKSNQQYFCSTQHGLPSINISRCHWCVCWLGHKWRKHTPRLIIPCKATGAMAHLCCLGLVLLSETEHFRLYSFSGCFVPAGQIHFLFPPLPFDTLLGTKICSVYEHVYLPLIRWRGVGFFAHLFFSSS